MCPHDRAGRYEVMGVKVCAGPKGDSSFTSLTTQEDFIAFI